MCEQLAVNVRGVAKVYRLYDRRLAQVLDLFGIRLPWQRPRFQEFWALRDVDIEVRKGERIGVIGRNGAGKSTLLRIIAGTLAPTAGAGSVRGEGEGLTEIWAGVYPVFFGPGKTSSFLASQGGMGWGAAAQ